MLTKFFIYTMYVFLVAHAYTDTASSTAPYRIENLPVTPALFEGIGNAVFYRNKWTIFTKITPLDFSEVLSFIDKCDAKIKQLCEPLETAFRLNCNRRTNELEVIVTNLRQNNIRLKHLVSPRRHKRAIETIGHFFHWAFGTMDNEDSEKIYNKLNTLDSTETETFNILKKQITVASSNFDRLSKPIKLLTAEVEQIGRSVDNITTDFENFATATIKEVAALKLKVEVNELISLITSKLLEVQNRQATELSIFVDLNQNKLHPFILDANNLTTLLKSYTFERSILNPDELYQAVKLLTFHKGESIVLKITVPLPEATIFSIHKIYPVSTELDHRWDLVLDIKTEYIAESDDHTSFVSMSHTELMQCSDVVYNSSISIKVCRHHKPIHTSGSSECLVELLQHSATSQINCNYVASPASKGVITKMFTRNKWLFNVREPLTLNFYCEGKLYAPELKGFGIVHIFSPCEISSKEMRLPCEQVWTANFRIHQPKVDHSELTRVLRTKYGNLTVGTIKKRPLLSLGSHNDLISSLAEGKKSLEDLKLEAEQNKDRHSVISRIREVEFHRYSLMTIGAIIVGIIILNILFKHYRSRSTPTSPNHVTTNITNVVPERPDALNIDAVEMEMEALPVRQSSTRKSLKGVTFARV